MKRIGKLNKKIIRNPNIFRIELLNRFYSILEKKELVFVKPYLWEDPLENLIFNAKITKNGKEYKHPAKDKIFGQCWSYEGDSYAIWKIYTTKQNDSGIMGRQMGVRITTNLNKLNDLSKINGGDLYYGQVEYLWKKELEKLTSDSKIIKALKDENINEEHLSTLLKKRKSYSYEKEVRLLAIPATNMINASKNFLCHVKIEPQKFITSIRFDPGMPYQEFKMRKEELVKNYHFNPKQITQSTYFHQNRFTIEI